MDIAIAGAGIAGLTAAAFLRRDGHRVVVFDQFEKPAPVGSGLIMQPTGQAVLSALGLLEALNARAGRIDRLYGKVTSTGRTALDVCFAAAGGAHGLGVHRAALFNLLYDAAMSAGADFEMGREVIGADEGRLAFRGGEQSLKFDLVIDALGLRSPLVERKNPFLDYGALWVNVPLTEGSPPAVNTLEQRYERASGTAGVMPIGSVSESAPQQAAFFWSLRQDSYEAWRAAGLDVWKASVLHLWPELEGQLNNIHDPEQIVFARYAHDTIPDPLTGGVVHIGDAWHAASPQLGQGANMAMLDAYALAKALTKNPDLHAALTAFVKTRRNHIRLYQTISGLFTPFYQSDSKILPVLRDWLLAPASQVPPMPWFLASMVAGTLGAPLRRIGLDQTE